jgi:polar amino acid transport system substrate-binding protein
MRARIVALLLLTFVSPLFGEDEAPKLRVGVFSRAPLAMKGADGRWEGISVELWERVSGQLGLAYEYVEMPLGEMIEKLHRGELDVALGEIDVSAERERLVDFTQPYLVTSGAAAIRRASSSFFGVGEALAGVFRNGVLLVVGLILGLLLIFSFVFWLVERRVHRTHFGGKPIHGFGSALWFAAVTMTTVGYGDKTPQTLPGRALAFVWMFLGIVLVSAFTGSVASSITMAELNRSVSSLHDLTRFRNGAVSDSLAEGMLREAGIPVRSFSDVTDGILALEDGQITAFVGNDVDLRYVVHREAPETVRVVTLPSLHVTFAMACRPDFPHLQALNVAILETVVSVDWSRQVQRWIGPSASR